MKPKKDLETIIDEILEPYAKELGLLLQAWNTLHSMLTRVFLKLCVTRDGEELPEDILLAVWNAIPNDRLQRRMLENAARVRFGRNIRHMDEIGIQLDPIRRHETRELEKILWLLEKADHLGRKRDESAHVPTVLFASGALTEVLPDDLFHHPIAEQLKDQNLIALFSLQRARIHVMITYASGISFALERGESLPPIPTWPTSPLPSGRKPAKDAPRAKSR